MHGVAQNRSDVKLKREDWMKSQKTMDSSKLVFLDESGVNTGMTRLYGRSKGKTRVVEYVPDVRFQRTSILSSIRLDGIMVPFAFQGSLNGNIFKQYISDCLAPTLRKGDVVVMDNLSSHKVKGVIEPIYNAGATVLYLPPYSPDLNPIELMWSKMKAYLCKVKARTSQSLYTAMGQALNNITQVDIEAWFNHDGYSLC